MPLRSDPGRLPRRNHYQEGPGFLFLATQGGRPLEADVAASVASVVRLRAAALRCWHEGDPAVQVAAELGIGRATLYRWQERYEEQGLTELVDAPRLGRASELDPVLEPTSASQCDAVASLVGQVTGWPGFGRRSPPRSFTGSDQRAFRCSTTRRSSVRI